MILVPSRPVGVAGSTPRPLSANSESGNDLRVTMGCRPCCSPGASAETPPFMGKQASGRSLAQLPVIVQGSGDSAAGESAQIT
jgi:hypothetical protein